MWGKSFIKQEIGKRVIYESKEKIPYEMVSSVHIIEKLFKDILDDIYRYLEKNNMKREYILLEEEEKVNILRNKFQHYLEELRPRKSSKMLAIFYLGCSSFGALLTLLGYVTKPTLYDILLITSVTASLILDYFYSKRWVKRRSKAARHLKIVGRTELSP